MTRYANVFILVLAVFVLAMTAAAQTGKPPKPDSAAGKPDRVGKPDTVYAEVGSIDPINWTITVSVANDEPVVGISVPLPMTAGLNRMNLPRPASTGRFLAHSILIWRQVS